MPHSSPVNLAHSFNRRAYFDYEILETYEAGVALYGFEVKAIKSGRINLPGAFVVMKNKAPSELIGIHSVMP